MKTIVWMREDLRLEDNFALHFAARNGQILPIFIYPDFCCDSQLKSGSSKTVGSKNAISIELGAASKWWLHHSLKSLQRAFSAHNVELILRRGNPEQILPQLVSEIEADAVVWNRVYSPAGMADGKRVKTALERAQIEHQSLMRNYSLSLARCLTNKAILIRSSRLSGDIVCNILLPNLV